MITLRQIVPASLPRDFALGRGGLRTDNHAVRTDIRFSRRPRMAPRTSRGGMGEMGFLLHKLNLTPEQKTQIKSIFAGQKAQFETLREQRQVEPAGSRNDAADRSRLSGVDTNGAGQRRCAHCPHEPNLEAGL